MNSFRYITWGIGTYLGRGVVVSDRVSQNLDTKSEFRDLRLFRHLIRVMSRQKYTETKKKKKKTERQKDKDQKERLILFRTLAMFHMC